MGFSSTPQEAAQEMDVFLGIADKLSILLDRDKLTETIKFANGLTSSEKATAEEARNSIAQYRTLIEEHSAKKRILDALEQSLADDKKRQDEEFAKKTSELEEKKSENNAAFNAIVEENKRLDGIRSSLNEKENSLAVRERELAVANQQLEVDRDRHRKDESALAVKKQEVADYEASLKAKAAQLQSLTQGL